MFKIAFKEKNVALLGVVHILRNRGWGGGLSKELKYYRGAVWQMITVYHESWVITLDISFPKT